MFNLLSRIKSNLVKSQKNMDLVGNFTEEHTVFALHTIFSNYQFFTLRRPQSSDTQFPKIINK